MSALNAGAPAPPTAPPIPVPASEPLLLTDRQAAALCGCSRASWHRWRAAGKLPPAVRLGRKLLWRRAEIVAWVDAGCPDAAAWQAIRERNRRLRVAQ
jgi:predicted DNA-binding transcriptional regulator AlpA